jgi:hypothetical protein
MFAVLDVLGFHNMAEIKTPPYDEKDVTNRTGLVQERLIGRVIVQSSRLDAGLNELIWRFFKMSIDDGRVLTGRMDAQVKIALLRKWAPRHVSGDMLKELQQALILADDIRDDRNFIVHGNWATMIADGVAIALSLRRKSEPGEIKAELFSHDRMRTIIRDISLVKNVLEKVVNSLPPLPEK